MRAPFKTLAAVALALTVATAQGQELKIGYVNLDRVLRDAGPAKAAHAKLESEFLRRDKELVDAEARLKTVSDRFEKDAPTLSESERLRRQRELVEQGRELQRKRRESQEYMNQRKNEELAALIDRANVVVRQIFDQEKYDLILQEAVFAGPRVDITDKVIRAMNAAPAK
ncbi:OmpH family outer membrane protein [Aquabacterium fontiphilum]|jgi:outer membrane protein|uniref:OmpH family outer membrane protein n=1 Tax=Aquabacterium fontiphilum TaxID=450365 RepID=UPI0013778B44|nr:OmpH family outer membrane protein [Aquabacterium fontiphilum]NBD21493.1 OmpH family outer membrane protein [Aquabacterium fontiphilum]